MPVVGYRLAAEFQQPVAGPQSAPLGRRAIVHTGQHKPRRLAHFDLERNAEPRRLRLHGLVENGLMIDRLLSAGRAELTGHVAPIQWGIRLLVTWESRLLELDDIRAVIGPFDSKTLTYPWKHRDPRVDHLQQGVMALAGVALTKSREETFVAVRELAHAARGAGKTARRIDLVLPSRAAIPYMNEPWYC